MNLHQLAVKHAERSGPIGVALNQGSTALELRQETRAMAVN